MSDYTQTPIGTGFNSASSINTEHTEIETAVNSKLDKSGGTLTGDLDLNSNKLLNVSPGLSATDGVNIQQLSDLVVITASADFVQTKTTTTMALLTGLVAGTSVVETSEFSTSKGGGATYDVVLTSSVTNDPFEFIVSVADPLISFTLRVDDKTTLPQFGVDTTGAVESSTALIVALRYNVKPTEGVVLVNPTSPIVIETDKNKLFVGHAHDVLEFVTDEDSGGIIFQISGQFNTVRNFSINSRDGTKKDFIGIEFGDTTAATSFTRGSIKTKVANATTGMEIRGWINDIELLAISNDLGIEGREFNATSLTLWSERNLKACDIENVLGTTFPIIMVEGLPLSGTTTAGRIDDFKGINIDTIYTESNYDTNVLTFGESVQGESVNINSGNITGSTVDKTAMIKFDNVVAATVNLDVKVGSTPAVVNFTANCEYVDSKVVGTFSTLSASQNKPMTQDNSLSVQIHANYMGDTYLDHFLATFPDKTDSNSVVSEENTILRSGERGIRITANAGTFLVSTTLKREVQDFPKLAGLAGKTVKAFAWIFVPDIPAFSNRTLIPSFGISAAGSSSSFPVEQRSMLAGQWNLVESEDLTIPWGGTGSDRIQFAFLLHFNATGTFDGSEFIIVDSIFLTETKTNIRDIMQGRIRESAKFMGIKTDGDILEIHSQTYHTLVASYITLAVGEVMVWRSSPAAAGKIGAVVTTAGTLGGTSVFKLFGAIDA